MFGINCALFILNKVLAEDFLVMSDINRKLHIKILHVEPNANYREYIWEMLSQQGYDVIGAEGIDSGLTKMMLHSPDILLINNELPSESGLHMLKMICEDDIGPLAPFNNLPCVFLTDRMSVVDQSRAMRYGVEKVFTKPCSPSLLINYLNSIYGKSKVKVFEEE